MVQSQAGGGTRPVSVTEAKQRKIRSLCCVTYLYKCQMWMDRNTYSFSVCLSVYLAAHLLKAYLFLAMINHQPSQNKKKPQVLFIPSVHDFIPQREYWLILGSFIAAFYWINLPDKSTLQHSSFVKKLNFAAQFSQANVNLPFTLITLKVSHSLSELNIIIIIFQNSSTEVSQGEIKTSLFPTPNLICLWEKNSRNAIMCAGWEGTLFQIPRTRIVWPMSQDRPHFIRSHSFYGPPFLCWCLHNSP